MFMLMLINSIHFVAGNRIHVTLLNISRIPSFANLAVESALPSGKFKASGKRRKRSYILRQINVKIVCDRFHGELNFLRFSYRNLCQCVFGKPN